MGFIKVIFAVLAVSLESRLCTPTGSERDSSPTPGTQPGGREDGEWRWPLAADIMADAVTYLRPAIAQALQAFDSACSLVTSGDSRLCERLNATAAVERTYPDFRTPPGLSPFPRLHSARLVQEMVSQSYYVIKGYWNLIGQFNDVIVNRYERNRDVRRRVHRVRRSLGALCRLLQTLVPQPQRSSPVLTITTAGEDWNMAGQRHVGIPARAALELDQIMAVFRLVLDHVADGT